MILNLNSVMVISVSIFTLIFLILLNMWLSNRKEFNSLLYIVIAFMLISINSFLILFRKESAGPISFVSQNFLTAAHYPLFLMGLSSIFKLKNRFYLNYVLMAVIFIMLVIFSFIRPSFVIRNLVTFTFIIYFNIKIIHNLFRIKLKHLVFWTVSIFVFIALILNWYIYNLVILIKNQPTFFDMNLSVSEGFRWSLLLAAVAGIGLYFISVITFLQREKLSNLLSQRDIILKETHHRIKNNLALIGSLINSKIADAKDYGDAYEEFLEDIIYKINTVTQIHDNLYKSSDYSTINLGHYIMELIDSIRKAHLEDGSEIEFSINVTDIRIKSNLCLSIGLIINELTTNSIKHAFKNTPKGIITITGTAEEDILRLQYSDNGCGFDYVDDTVSDSFGLKMIKALAEQINSKLDIETEDGCNYSFIIPINYKK